MRMSLVLVSVLVVMSACSLRTAGAPTGGYTLTAQFNDSQNLVAGHSVQIADYKIGSVTKVELVTGYKSKVTLSIKDKYKIPEGTSAEVAVTSLLGENFVRLAPPRGGDLSQGPYLANGARIAQTSEQPQFEQVVEKAGPLVSALAAGDISSVVEAGAIAFRGNGQKLNTAIGQSSELVAIFGKQRGELGVAVDQLAKLGRSLAKSDKHLSLAPGELERTTKLLDKNKGETLRLVEQLTRTTKLLGDKVLEGRVAKMKTLLRQIDPVVAKLGGERARLTLLTRDLERFVTKFPRSVNDGSILLDTVLKLTPPDGKPFKLPARPKLPEGLGGVLPELDEILGEPR